jgi:hypothetical protein
LPGVQGPPGSPGVNSLIDTRPIDPGPICEEGGVLISVGLDDGISGVAGDNILQAGEIDADEVLCNGEGTTVSTMGASPLGMVAIEPGSSSSNLILLRGGFGNTLRVRTAQAGDLQWLGMPLSLPLGSRITNVRVCYDLTSDASYISQIRLSEEIEPPTATIIHDDNTNLQSTDPTCYDSAVNNVEILGAVTLLLRLNFASTGDTIHIGSVFVDIEN